MSGNDDLSGVTACIDAIVSRYNDAATIIQKVKAARASKQAPAPSRYLEETIQCTPEDILKEKERGLGRFGLAFQQGDDAALSTLREVNNTLERKLVQELHRLANSEELVDFKHLVDEADSGRDHTIDTLIRLRQRCLAAETSDDHDSRHQSDSSITPLASSTTREAHSPPPAIERAKTYHFPHQHNPWLKMHGRSHTTRMESRDASGEEDAQSGAENHKKHGHGGSLLHFLKHHRGHSHDEKAHEPAILPDSSKAAPRAGLGEALTRQQTNQSMVSLGSQEAQAPSWWPGILPEPGPLQRQSSELSQHRDSEASVDTIVGISPTAQSYRSRAASTATARLRNSSLAVPTATQDNDYLGFCKGAVRLQNGDKKAMEKRKEFNDGWSQSTVYYLACSSNKCSFAGHIDINVIMTKVFTVEAKGLCFRWPFLAKSHVVQIKMRDTAYSFQCLFCIFSGEKSQVYRGSDIYLDHVSTHRGEIGAVTLYKARCINDRIADASDDFDINLFPLSSSEARSRRASEMLSDELMALHLSPYGMGKNDSVIEADKPWNEGLSDFHYQDEFVGGEMG